MQQSILVTGGAGLVGSHLCARLAQEGHRVTSLDNYFAGSKNVKTRGVEYREGHTKDIETLVPEKIDLVYHLGEYARVEVSLTEPDLVWDLNVRGTFSVLEYWRKRHCKLIYAGSSTKFADGGLGRDQSPYAWTKATNTELVRNYGEWYGLPFAITYFYNVYGPGERAGKYGTVIEIFKQRHTEKQPLLVTAPGTQRRIFTHIDDIVDGLIAVGARGAGDEFGIGADRSYSILEIAELFGDPIEMRPEVQGNRMSATLDVSKMHALGWHASHDVADYIRAFKKSAV